MDDVEANAKVAYWSDVLLYRGQIGSGTAGDCAAIGVLGSPEWAKLTQYWTMAVDRSRSACPVSSNSSKNTQGTLK